MNFSKFTLDEIDLIMDALQEKIDELMNKDNPNKYEDDIYQYHKIQGKLHDERLYGEVLEWLWKKTLLDKINL